MEVLKADNGIVRGYIITLTILPIIFFLTVILTWWFVPNGIIGLIIGTMMTFFFGLGQIGKNMNNIKDYLETNERHFTKSPEQAAQAILLS